MLEDSFGKLEECIGGFRHWAEQHWVKRGRVFKHETEPLVPLRDPFVRMHKNV